MPLTPLTDANAALLPDGRVLFFPGNRAASAGGFSLSRLDGTGAVRVTSAVMTLNGKRHLLLYIGDSHVAGSVATPPGLALDPLLSGASAAFEVYSQAEHNYAVGGIKSTELRTMQIPALIAYIEQVRADYDQVICLVGGNTNDVLYSNMQYVDPIRDAKRFNCQLIAKAGAKVVVYTMPPDASYDAAHNNVPSQLAIVEQMRDYLDTDVVQHFRTEYAASACTATHRLDPELYNIDSYVNYPQNFAVDVKHYNATGQLKVARRHILPSFVAAAEDVVPARLAPTALVVNAGTGTLNFTKTALDALGVHEYSLDAGVTWLPISNNPSPTLPVSLHDGTYAAGDIRVRVAAYGSQVAGPALVSTAAYTIGGTPADPNWADALFSETQDSANVDVVDGYSCYNVQTANYSFESIAYELHYLPANVDTGFEIELDNTVPYECFLGVMDATAVKKLTPQVPFPDYGVKIDNTNVYPSNQGGTTNTIPFANKQILRIMRETTTSGSGKDLVYYLGGQEVYRVVGIPLTGQLIVVFMGGYAGSFIKKCRLFPADQLVLR